MRIYGNGKGPRKKLVTVLLGNITEEEGKEKALEIIRNKGYSPINIIWRKKPSIFPMYDELECHFDIN